MGLVGLDSQQKADISRLRVQIRLAGLQIALLARAVPRRSSAFDPRFVVQLRADIDTLRHIILSSQALAVRKTSGYHKGKGGEGGGAYCGHGVVPPRRVDARCGGGVSFAPVDRREVGGVEDVAADLSSQAMAEICSERPSVRNRL